MYRKGSEIQFLQSVPRLGILVVNTRTPRDTRKLVAGVGALKTKYPLVMKPILESVEAIVEEWLTLLRNESAVVEAADATASFVKTAASEKNGAATPQFSMAEIESRAGDLMRLNQGLLDAMGVGHAVIHKVLQLAASHGFTAGKLTGAGGGGCVIILQPSAAAASADAASSSSATAAASSASAATPSLSGFTSALQSSLNCEYLETVVGQAGVWIRNGVSLRQLPELQGSEPQ